MEGLIMAGQLILGLSILVTLHEFGHFITAKWFKMRVDKFYLFFDFLFPRKKSLNWFIPAFVNNKVGSFFTTIGAEGTIWCCLEAKKSKYFCRISAAVNIMIPCLD